MTSFTLPSPPTTITLKGGGGEREGKRDRGVGERKGEGEKGEGGEERDRRGR